MLMAVVEGGGSAGGQGLAVTRTAVIFSEAGVADGDEGAIVSVPAQGGDRTTLASTRGLANALVADGRNVYFVDGEGTKSVPLAGGSVRTLTSQMPYSLLVDGSILYLVDHGPTGTVESIPVDGGAPSTLAVDPNGALHPVRCGENLCWVGGPALDASLKQLDREGNVTTLAGGLSEPHDVVFDGANFYMSSGGGGLFLYRIPAAGGRPALIHAAGGLSSLALDDACLYWSSFDGIYGWARNVASTAPDMAL